MNEGRPVGAVIALKRLRHAKTRLELAAPLRERLAWYMFLDTVTALASAADHTVVVSDQDGLQPALDDHSIPAVVVAEGDSDGMNAALGRGEQELRDAGALRILACVGDLPCLCPTGVRTVLAAFAASAAPRAFVPDATGIGTTMLLATDGPLDPHFQGPSAAAHAATGAVALTGDPGRAADVWHRVRRDVDTRADLAEAITLGLGPWTSTLIDPATGTLAG